MGLPKSGRVLDLSQGSRFAHPWLNKHKILVLYHLYTMCHCSLDLCLATDEYRPWMYFRFNLLSQKTQLQKHFKSSGEMFTRSLPNVDGRLSRQQTDLARLGTNKHDWPGAVGSDLGVNNRTRPWVNAEEQGPGCGGEGWRWLRAWQGLCLTQIRLFYKSFSLLALVWKIVLRGQ